jgi:ABC-type branched-subunit amino acid transport system substrate-binding protein
VTATTIDIGATITLTGSVGAGCTALRNGLQAWLDYANKHGGVNGRTVTYTALDDQGSSPQAVANTKTLEQKPIFAMVGACTANTPTAFWPILQQDQVPMLFPYSANADLVSPVQKYVFSLVPLYPSQTTAILQYALGKYGAGTVYGLFAKIPAGQALLSAAKTATANGGGTWLGNDDVTIGTADMTPFITRMRAKGTPDYVLLDTSSPDTARLINTMEAQAFAPRKGILGWNAMATEAVTNVVHWTSNTPILSLSPTAPPDSSESALCDQAFKSASPAVQSGGYSLFGCAAAQIFIAAAKKAGANLTRDGLVSALESMQGVKVSDVIPPITLSPSNHMALTTMYQVTLKGAGFVVTDKVQVQCC